MPWLRHRCYMDKHKSVLSLANQLRAVPDEFRFVLSRYRTTEWWTWCANDYKDFTYVKLWSSPQKWHLYTYIHLYIYIYIYICIHIYIYIYTHIYIYFIVIIIIIIIIVVVVVMRVWNVLHFNIQVETCGAFAEPPMKSTSPRIFPRGLFFIFLSLRFVLWNIASFFFAP